ASSSAGHAACSSWADGRKTVQEALAPRIAPRFIYRQRAERGAQRTEQCAAQSRGGSGTHRSASEILVVGSRSAFWRDPGDDLVRILDVAGLAVHAVGGV